MVDYLKHKWMYYALSVLVAAFAAHESVGLLCFLGIISGWCSYRGFQKIHVVAVIAVGLLTFSYFSWQLTKQEQKQDKNKLKKLRNKPKKIKSTYQNVQLVVVKMSAEYPLLNEESMLLCLVFMEQKESINLNVKTLIVNIDGKILRSI